MRAETFGVERLEEHARDLAQQHQIGPSRARGNLLAPRLKDNRRALAAAHSQFARAVEAKQAVPPAAEWLLDNYYVVQEQLREIDQDLSGNYYRELPKLANSHWAGYPRVYALGIEFIAHTDSRLDADVLVRYVSAYETVKPLSMGELWAIPIMLRLGLVENLRRLVDESMTAMLARQEADRWADRLIDLSNTLHVDFVVAIATLARQRGGMDPLFGVQLLQRFRDQDVSLAPAIRWLSERLAEHGEGVEAVIRAEHYRRASNRVSVGNAITSMRLLSVIDWRTFFEQTSVVERTLRLDPAGAFPRMEWGSRDRYRHIVERLGRGSELAEETIARRAVDLAAQWQAAAPHRPETEERRRDSRQAHVGYYLLDQGRAELAQAVGYRPSVQERVGAWILAHPTPIYVGSIILLTLLMVAALAALAAGRGAPSLWLALLALVAVIPASALAVSVINWTITSHLPPRTPPRLEFKEDLPPDCRTMVVVPALLSSTAGIERLLEGLELRLLANQDPHLHFALLGDFADAPQPHMPEDDELIAAAVNGIGELNARYGNGRADRFYFFHRQRCWNPSEQTWMGWERKRGKLIAFNRLLRGARDTDFTVRVGDLDVLPQVRYVITLDADTVLPPNSAKRLIGAIAHPLNRAILDPATRRVVAGYGVIQPRTAVKPPLDSESLFVRIFAGDTGLDPYSSASSDVYQDLFGAGSFVGKAIYDPDIALAALDHRFPENQLLSHDLIEGAHVRVGLASDIELLEDFPSGYDAQVQRDHRWIRGDWQIADWLLPRVPDAHGRRVPNVLGWIDRWKILDNLRRSLLAPSVVLLLALSWLGPSGSSGIWTVFGLLAVVFPLLVSLVNAARVHPVGEPWRSYFWSVGETAMLNAIRGLILVAFLPFEALSNLHAIMEVAVRRLITHQNLLQWTRFDRVQRRQARELSSYLARMWPATALGASLLALVLAARSPALGAAAPVLLVWMLSPALAALISVPLRTREAQLPPEARRELRVMARQTWHFFEVFVGDEDHWLPPDNYDANSNRVAHRTSPTNIGFALLSNLAAMDFGYLAPGQVAERLEKTLDSLDSLERYRGHFLNWYDTLTCQPLYPQYVSTVDSGNLAACLMAIAQACFEMGEGLTVDLEAAASGLEDTVAALRLVLARYDDPHDPTGPAITVKELGAVLEAIERQLPHIHEESTFDELAQLAASFMELERRLERELGNMRLANLAACGESLERQIAGFRADLETARSADQSRALTARLRELGMRAQAFVEAMDFAFLYDRQLQVFATGYNLTAKRLDNSYYDLLETEARLTSIVAIARGQVPAAHWFKLARPLTRIGRDLALLSWGGTMFEYLMAPLLLRDFEQTLLAQTSRAAVRRHIEYGREHDVPWGISESGFYAFSGQGEFQYRLFGVPGLGLRREPVHNLVIAPYATFLALPVAPKAALENLRRLAREGMRGDYGYYEAIDYTPSRRPKDQRAGIVRSHMAHHHGMSFIALANYMHGDLARQRFHADPSVAAVELLLQERIPQHAPLAEPHPDGEPLPIDQSEHRQLSTRRFTTPHTATPRVHLLSNGAYTVMLTNAGGGYSAYGNRLITRWRQDITRDATGTFCYIRDRRTGQFWSTGYQPTVCKPEETYEVIYGPDKATFRRRDYQIESQTEIAVSPRYNAEVRRIALTNHSSRDRELELTSYAEVVLDTPKADLAHPAFSKLFVRSEYVPEHQALLFERRRRSAKDEPLWAGHLLCIEGQPRRVTGYETDRARFLGRGNTLANPDGLARPLSNSTGAVLDPIMSLRCSVRLAPGETVRVSFVTLAADSREAALALCGGYADPRNVEEAFDLAYAQSQVELRHLNITAEDAHLFQRLAALIMFPDPGLRAPSGVALNNVKGQTGLWPYGISGDYPIVLVTVDAMDEIDLVRQALHAHEFLRLNNFVFDLVILNEHPTSYLEGLHAQLQGLIDSSLSRPWVDRPGGVFLRRTDSMPQVDRTLLQTLARVILDGELGSLTNQLDRATRTLTALTSRDTMAAQKWNRRERRQAVAAQAPPRSSGEGRKLIAPPKPGPLFNNGLGGFDPTGREYVIVVDQDTWTPAPWTNVLANTRFGCLVTESGLGYTWAENSQTNRLTPWSNDPVSDPQGEAIFVRDEETGEFWSPTPLPVHGLAPYRVRHGAGYSVYEHTSHGLGQELVVFVPPEDPVKVARLRLRNLSKETRRVSITGYAEWVLGVTREEGQLFVATEMDTAAEVLWARSVYNAEFSSRHAFASITHPVSSFTADRSEFLGHTGSCAAPVGMLRAKLSGRTGFGLDPCAALRSRFEIKPGQEIEWTFLLGETEDEDRALELVGTYRDPGRVQAALHAAKRQWDELLGTVQVKTPDPAMDLVLNRWLLYQALACRIWARSAFYQSGGAFGFRDQLQDVLALVWAAPELARAHILEAASHQFQEGDVQHWWQPPVGQGLRTRFSDDYLWLPYVTNEYIVRTQDRAILDEPVRFLQAPPLEPDQDEAYGTAAESDEVGTLYEHCARAIDHGLRFGRHGLPLMGNGDWNDGMNRVGSGGEGESVWVGWFLLSNLTAFAPIARARGDSTRASRYPAEAERLRGALEAHGWDGAWYRRAYFDDGTPLGSASSDECKIDSIAQTWGVISQGAPPERAAAAMQAVERWLVRERDRLILLLTPPFDQAAHDPGYIRGYVPGVRENGGQYTHAALWVILAYTLMGNGNRAMQLFRMINPINHSRTREEAARYKVEPYVVAADVYSQSLHVGRGGWTWYTGSSGWMYRIGVESILGLRRRGAALSIEPCIPADWKQYQLFYRYRSSRYEITVENPKGKQRGVARIELDGTVLPPGDVPLQDDGQVHEVRVTLG